MHELLLAHKLVEAAETALRPTQIKKVAALHIRLGALAGVSKDALVFGYDLANRNTLVQGVRLEIEELPVIIYCEECQKAVTLLDPIMLCCPVCGKFSLDIRQGKELELSAIEFLEESETGQ